MDTAPLNWTFTSYYPSPWGQPPDCKPREMGVGSVLPESPSSTSAPSTMSPQPRRRGTRRRLARLPVFGAWCLGSLLAGGVPSHTGIPHPAGVTPRILLKEEGTGKATSTEPTPSLLHGRCSPLHLPLLCLRVLRVAEAQMNPLQHYLLALSWRTGGLPGGWCHWGTHALVTDLLTVAPSFGATCRSEPALQFRSQRWS